MSTYLVDITQGGCLYLKVRLKKFGLSLVHKQTKVRSEENNCFSVFFRSFLSLITLFLKETFVDFISFSFLE